MQLTLKYPGQYDYSSMS